MSFAYFFDFTANVAEVDVVPRSLSSLAGAGKVFGPIDLDPWAEFPSTTEWNDV